MQKPLTIMFQLLAAGMMLLGNAPAQQTPAATTPNTQPAQAAPAKKDSATPAKKAPATTRSATAMTLKTQKEKASYALGMKIGGDLKRQGVGASVDAALTARGLKDGLAGTKALLTEDEEKAALTQLQTEVRGKMEAKAHEAGKARLVSRERRHQRLDRGPAVDAGRIQMAAVYPARYGLWRSRRRCRHWSGRNSDFRSGVALNRAEEVKVLSATRS